MANSPTEEKKKLFASLSVRERKLLLALAATFSVLAMVIGIYFFKQSQDTTRQEIEQYRTTLEALQEYGPTYIEQQSQAEAGDDADVQRFSAEVLKNNKLKLTSFVATHASAVDLKVDNYDEDQLPLSTGNDKGPIITENLIKVDIKEGDMDKVILLLDRIEKSKEPVIIKRINLRNLSRAPGKVRANLVISTYVQKDQEG